tara:strand:+ start:14116 stop:15372 length:1257 start_codon:yes stop_codon:yes gene_type:complete
MNKILFRYFAALLVFSIFLFFSTESRSEKGGADKKNGPPPATGVKVEKVKNETVQETISIVGSVESPRVSRIGSEVEGIVEKIFIDEGDMVKKVRPLLQLSNSQLKINILEAKAEEEESKKNLEELKAGSRPLEIEEAKAAMNEAAALWTKAKNEYERNKRLFKDKVIDERLLTNSGLEADAAERAYHQKKFAYDLSLEGTRKEEIEKAEASVNVKKAKVFLLEDQLKKTTIFSPFTGVIVDKLVEIGEWVDAGQQVFRISQIDPIRITLPVPESVVGQINIGTEVDVQVNAFTDRTFTAKVYKIIPEAQKGSRTFPVILVLRNPEIFLKIGMMVKGMLPYGTERKALFVPQDAITVSKEQNVVYVVDKDNKAKMVPVKTGIQRKSLIEVNGNLSPGDLVVTRGGERLRPGMPLKILN